MASRIMVTLISLAILVTLATAVFYLVHGWILFPPGWPQ